MDEVNEAEAMEKALARMSDGQREHLKLIIKELLTCYLNEEVHGLLLVGANESPKIKLFAVNSNEMDASGLLTAADQYIHFKVMDDAPPKELFN